MKTSFFTLIFLGIILVCQTGRAAISSIHEPSESHGPPLSQPLFTFEPQDLQRLSDSGFDFAGILHGKGPSNAELYSSSGLPSLARVISADLEIENLEAALRNSEYQGNVQILKMDWLTSADHGFTLVGVVARPDRVTANPEGCGEIRFIYRLSKLRSAEPSADGRFLPMTAMAVFDARQLLKLKTCKEIGKLLTKGRPKSGQLADSILSTARSPRDLPKRIEINALASLWPYTSREQTADQARYVLRVFEFDSANENLLPANLENTPSPEIMRNSPSLLEDLKSFLRKPESIQRIRLGSLVLPQKFLTKKSISISPYGWTRLTNSPFSAILSSDASFSKEELKRLDSMSCVGCHQQQAVAGFHVLGIDDSLTEKFLTPLAPFSSYFDGIQLWRSDQVKRLASGRRQTPFPIVNRSHDGTTGDACGEGQSCAAHFSCQKRRAFQSYGDNLGGLCEPNKDSDSVVGDPCDSSHLNTFEDAFRDEFIPGFHDSCGKGGVCAYAKAGFPGGYCSKPCTLTETATTCTPVPVLGNFSICVDRFGTFRTCAKNHSILSDMKLCTKVNDCRRDYTCVYRDEKSAICVPPYFLPDLTLGQHN